MAQRRSYSRETRLKVQRLYIGKSMEPREISAELGIPVQQVYNICHRYGLAEIRRKNESRALARAEDKAQSEALEFLESVTPQAMELTEIAFDGARKAGNAGDGKEFAMFMKGGQIAVQIARQGLGLDAKGAATAARDGAATLVFCRFGDASQPAEKRAESVDVQAQEVSEEVILDFEQSQQGDSRSAESVALIGNSAQVVDNASG
jgi:hypothetical protein